jgi:hypothetical protein
LKKTAYYIGDYEKEVVSGGSTKEYDYICTPEGLSVIAVKTGDSRSFLLCTDRPWALRALHL